MESKLQEHREQGETRQLIIDLLRRRSPLTAAELSDALGIGAVGVRQHLALLERDNLVKIAGVRRSVGRPSHLYSLTAEAEALFPRGYDRFVMDALSFVLSNGGTTAVDNLFENRRQQLAAQYAPHLAGKSLAEQAKILAKLLNEQGYMCEASVEPDGTIVLVQHNCPIDCVAREYNQACSQELTLYEGLLQTGITLEGTIANGSASCRYRIRSS